MNCPRVTRTVRDSLTCTISPRDASGHAPVIGKSGCPLWGKSFAADGVGLRGKESTLIIVQEQSHPAQFVEQSFDLSVLEFDDLLLPAVDDATEYGEQNVRRAECARR